MIKIKALMSITSALFSIILCSCGKSENDASMDKIQKIAHLRSLKVCAEIPVYKKNVYWKGSRAFEGCFLFSGDAYISVDLNKAQYKEIKKDKILQISLPCPAVSDAVMHWDENGKDVFWHTEVEKAWLGVGSRGLGDKDVLQKLQSTARDAAKAELRKKAIDGDIINLAKQQTTLALEAFYQSAGYETVNIVWER